MKNIFALPLLFYFIFNYLFISSLTLKRNCVIGGYKLKSKYLYMAITAFLDNPVKVSRDLSSSCASVI